MKYQELANIIRKDIKDGEYREQEKLPTEMSLMKQYKVSRYCVRNAIDILTELGLVYPVQGSGIYIRDSKKEGCLSLGSTRGLTAELSDKKVETEVPLIEFIQADEKIAQRMKCKVGTPLYYLIRIRKADGEPMAVEHTYYNQEIVNVIDEKIASGSLFSYIKKDLGLNIAFADKVLSCDKLPEREAGYLNLHPGDPAIIIEDDVYLSNGQMFNASRVYYNYQMVKFFDLAEIK